MIRVLICAALVISQAAAPAPSGLLLGLSTPSGPRTLWLAPDGGEWRTIAEGNGLLVPRPSGFWWVGVARPTADWFDTFAWAAPVGKPLVITGPRWEKEHVADLRRYGGVHEIGVTFAGPEIVTIGESFEVHGPQLAYNHMTHALSIDALTKPATADATFFSLEIDAALGRGAGAALRQAADAAGKSGIDEFHTPEFVENATLHWSIGRRRGLWTAAGSAGYGSGAMRGYSIDFDVPFSIPAAVTGPASPPPPWHAIFDRVPDAIDAITSPRGNVVMLTTPHRLWIFQVEAGRLTRPLAVVPFPNGSEVVMTQWATGASVARWTREVVPLLRAGIPAVQDRRDPE